MEALTPSDTTLVKIIELSSGREIAWGGNMTEELRGRFGDVQRAIADGVEAVGVNLRNLATVEGWEVGELTATFGIALAAEAGVVLTKASGEATFEVSVNFRRVS